MVLGMVVQPSNTVPDGRVGEDVQWMVLGMMVLLSWVVPRLNRPMQILIL